MTVATRTFDVAVLCSGNRFRSPLAAQLLRRRVAGLGVRVASAATTSALAAAALVEAIELAEEYGVDLATHRSRPLPAGALAAADLVLGFEPDHVAAAIATGAAPQERSFTLPELVRLLDDADTSPLAGLPELERARRAVTLAHERRLEATGETDAPPALADPLGHPHVVFVELAATIDRLVGRLCAHVFAR